MQDDGVLPFVLPYSFRLKVGQCKKFIVTQEQKVAIEILSDMHFKISATQLHKGSDSKNIDLGHMVPVSITALSVCQLSNGICKKSKGKSKDAFREIAEKSKMKPWIYELGVKYSMRG